MIDPCEVFYASKGMNDELVSFFDSININQVLKDAELVERILGRPIVYARPTEELLTELVRELSAKIIPIDARVNVGWLEQIYNSYLKDLNWTSLTEEQVKAKRDYLRMIWNKKVSELLKTKLDASARLQDCIKHCSQRYNLYKKTKKALQSQRDKYIDEIISDMKILFYIYSGRIMQDCHYGRGLLIKPNFPKKRILFVSGSYKSDVDALYNMSSGQLVSLSIAFLLTLNKLYARSPMIAIDDPVQTIDDINLWGLIETLRHDFNQHFLLLSTHEQDYSQLLRDKFLK
ncbi:exonuclease SbcC [Succinivibrio dextrinosolvens DSM 3072]|uniref:Exonuclease SbcC n=1 Tax=Succinivibrio dextrinosolvens DSM 3072 TaxID=1123324 RepID=A0A1T4VHD3_9GAMM|nr:exonuclease SbcC [Succinivibrio dextrinosolvens DSM 3072]